MRTSYLLLGAVAVAGAVLLVSRRSTAAQGGMTPTADNSQWHAIANSYIDPVIDYAGSVGDYFGSVWDRIKAPFSGPFTYQMPINRVPYTPGINPSPGSIGYSPL